ncbi:hypothetical protein A2291_02935 [candidate division WOR-1 bacterium RIFOXYB2_FULL_42_35]|uniref:Uncharacterized protein n=1 Tax=candidate division WOR-1 bacterium RIFOXYC2_FULL_41_25 TaxID=1802586 RepID=A0A1F4TR14_UNCSA|nr:MAG: hypothetical protein A2247_01245 [candidate division WOR-1 bacterium RIFOXYA2_FULL_41_14]OGC25704.1 MAG: hypothetical protein A2291_02935 [candidate division WOR-1 bacterium RIFOXYB2_FULL_42_35]OGC35106.1 MAG: hypothetical protein A2462_06080 [candidate division WOR-1 bacterium RIFOXYC2_FULL_41_25]OGC43958.1 MAG: hypothetical protein A2548_05415 [candidate division WOR-1 bacterium RIFOXYD2_FULL_41_8]
MTDFPVSLGLQPRISLAGAFPLHDVTDVVSNGLKGFITGPGYSLGFGLGIDLRLSDLKIAAVYDLQIFEWQGSENNSYEISSLFNYFGLEIDYALFTKTLPNGLRWNMVKTGVDVGYLFGQATVRDPKHKTLYDFETLSGFSWGVSISTEMRVGNQGHLAKYLEFGLKYSEQYYDGARIALFGAFVGLTFNLQE